LGDPKKINFFWFYFCTSSSGILKTRQKFELKKEIDFLAYGTRPMAMD